jgi:hypothetical protein
MSQVTTNGHAGKQQVALWTLVLDGVGYVVRRLVADPAVAVKAFRLEKHSATDPAVYDVSLSPAGHLACECKGFLRWNKPCKHILALQDVGMLPETATVAPPANGHANGNGHTYPLPGDDSLVQIVNDPPSTASADDWADVRAAQLEAEAERAATYQMLVEWARDSLASAAVPCTCCDRSCGRCQVEQFVNG